MIKCCHWSAFGAGGKCAANLFGGKPSKGTCGQCKDRNRPLAEIARPSFRVKMRNVTVKGQPCLGCGGKVIEFRETTKATLAPSRGSE